MHDETATAGRLISPLRTALAPWFAPTRGAQEFSVGVACAPRRHVTVSAAKPVVGAVRLLLEPAFDVRDGPCEQPARILRQRELDQAAWDSTVEAFQRSGLEPETDRGGWPVYRIQDAGETIVLHLAPDGPQLVRFRGVEVDLATPRLEAVVLEKMIARVCRVALTRDLQDSGWRLLHASALAGPEGAVAFVGAKYAGKTTAMLLACVPDWRWLLDREDCPWYPTARLYRQPEPGKWSPILEQAAADLSRLG